MGKLLLHIFRWVIAGGLYGLMEIVYRGYTHWSMVLLAVLLSIPLDICNEHLPWEMPIWLQAICGGVIVTLGELVTGLLLNVWLGFDIWNYSKLWGNLWGQICIQFTVRWMVIAGVVIVLFDWLDYWISDGKRPHYKWI